MVGQQADHDNPAMCTIIMLVLLIQFHRVKERRNPSTRKKRGMYSSIIINSFAEYNLIHFKILHYWDIQGCQTKKMIIKKRTVGGKYKTSPEKSIFYPRRIACIPNISPLIIPMSIDFGSWVNLNNFFLQDTKHNSYLLKNIKNLVTALVRFAPPHNAPKLC